MSGLSDLTVLHREPGAFLFSYLEYKAALSAVPNTGDETVASPATRISAMNLLSDNMVHLTQLRHLRVSSSSGMGFLDAAFGDGTSPGLLRQLSELDLSITLDEVPLLFDSLQLPKAIVTTCPHLRMLRLPNIQLSASLFELLSSLRALEELHVDLGTSDLLTWEPLRKCKHLKRLFFGGDIMHMQHRIISEDLAFAVIHHSRETAFMPDDSALQRRLLDAYLSHNLCFSPSDIEDAAYEFHLRRSELMRHPFIVASLREATELDSLATRSDMLPMLLPIIFPALAAASHPDPDCSRQLLEMPSFSAAEHPHLVAPPTPAIRTFLQKALFFVSSDDRFDSPILADSITSRFPGLIDDVFMFRSQAAEGFLNGIYRFLQAKDPNDPFFRRAFTETGVPPEYYHLCKERRRQFDKECLVSLAFENYHMPLFNAQEFWKRIRPYYLAAHDGDESCLSRLLAAILPMKTATVSLMQSGKLPNSNIDLEKLVLHLDCVADLNIAQQAFPEGTFRGKSIRGRTLDMDFIGKALQMGMIIHADFVFNTMGSYPFTILLKSLWPLFLDSKPSDKVRAEILIRAVKLGYVDTVRILVELGEDPSASAASNEGANSLHHVTPETTHQIVACLVGRGVDINQRTSQGCTPIQNALRHSSPEAILGSLIKFGAHIGWVDSDGESLFTRMPSLDWLAWTPVDSINRVEPDFFQKHLPDLIPKMMAKGNPTGIKCLLSAFKHLDWDLDVKHPDTGQNFFEYVYSSRADICRAVLQHVQHGGQKWASRLLPVLAAQSSGLMDTTLKDIKSVVEITGTDIDSCEHNPKGRTAFLELCFAGADSAILYLLEKGCNPCMRDYDGMTALMLLARSAGVVSRECVLKVCEFALAKDASILDATDLNGKSALWHALQSRRAGIVPFLLEAGAKWNESVPLLHAVMGKSAAMEAIISYYEQHSSDQLLQLYKELYSSDGPPCSALRAALQVEDEKCSKLLLLRGAPIEGDTVELVGRFQRIRIAISLRETLRKRGVDVSSLESLGSVAQDDLSNSHAFSTPPATKQTLGPHFSPHTPSFFPTLSFGVGASSGKPTATYAPQASSLFTADPESSLPFTAPPAAATSTGFVFQWPGQK